MVCQGLIREGDSVIMPTLTNILTVLNLLYNRQTVSIRSIQEECGVSRSTAYRYITTISEANFPVIRDQEVGGFRLTYKWGKGVCSFSEAEAEFIVTACEQDGQSGGDGNGNGALSRSISRKLEVFQPMETNRKLALTL